MTDEEVVARGLVRMDCLGKSRMPEVRARIAERETMAKSRKDTKGPAFHSVTLDEMAEVTPEQIAMTESVIPTPEQLKQAAGGIESVPPDPMPTARYLAETTITLDPLWMSRLQVMASEAGQPVSVYAEGLVRRQWVARPLAGKAQR